MGEVAPATVIRSACAWLRPLAWAALALSGAGCSLISLKSPETPLSTRDLNTRILTREYSARFIAGVAQSADAIATDSPDAGVQRDALRWKIAAAGASQRAASQMAPTMSLLDSWALAVQMEDFLSSGAGQSLFGSEQPRALLLATTLSQEAQDLSRRLLPAAEFEHDQRFIADYARVHPIESLQFARASIMELWAHESGANVRLVDSLGTIPEAMADAGDLLRMYSDSGSSQLLWKAQLAAQESGLNGAQLQSALQRLDERMSHVTLLADETPELVNGVMRDARLRLNASWLEMLSAIHTESGTLARSVSGERQAAVDAVDQQRVALSADAARISHQVVDEVGDQVRQLVREALLLLIALTLLVLGLPFAAGYWVGRARGHRP